MRKVAAKSQFSNNDNFQYTDKPPFDEIKPSVVYYGTFSGTIGFIKTISEEDFRLLKQIELDAIKYIDIKEQFSYEQWRKRIPQEDKMIDSTVIKYYLQEFRYKITVNQERFYDEVKEVYERATGTEIKSRLGG